MRFSKCIIIARAAIIALGVCAIVLGVLQGDAMDTLRKAITVCLECIGIG